MAIWTDRAMRRFATRFSEAEQWATRAAQFGSERKYGLARASAEQTREALRAAMRSLPAEARQAIRKAAGDPLLPPVKPHLRTRMKKV